MTQMRIHNLKLVYTYLSLFKNHCSSVATLPRENKIIKKDEFFAYWLSFKQFQRVLWKYNMWVTPTIKPLSYPQCFFNKVVKNDVHQDFYPNKYCFRTFSLKLYEFPFNNKHVSHRIRFITRSNNFLVCPIFHGTSYRLIC